MPFFWAGGNTIFIFAFLNLTFNEKLKELSFFYQFLSSVFIFKENIIFMLVNHLKIACEPNTNYNYQNFTGQLISYKSVGKSSHNVSANCLKSWRLIVCRKTRSIKRDL